MYRPFSDGSLIAGLVLSGFESRHPKKNLMSKWATVGKAWPRKVQKKIFDKCVATEVLSILAISLVTKF
jgi:hypothetical protein